MEPRHPGRRRRPDPETLYRSLRADYRRTRRALKRTFDLNAARLETRELATVLALDAVAVPQVLSPPNGQYVPIRVTGTYTVAPGAPKAQVNFQVVDEYRLVQPAGDVKSQRIKGQPGRFRFSFTTYLQARVASADSSGRQYSMSVAAYQQDGSAGKSIGFAVPQPGQVVVVPNPGQAQALASRGRSRGR
jgi:hypothetical protein